MPGSRLRSSSSTTSHSSPPHSETNSGSTPDLQDRQSLGARLRRGAHMASNNAVLRRMYSLGGGNSHRDSGGGSNSGNYRQQQHHHQQQAAAVAPAGSTNATTGPGIVRPSRSSDSLGSTDGTAGGNKWVDMSFYSLFARSGGVETRGQSASSAGVSVGVGGAAGSTLSNNSSGILSEEDVKRRPSSSRGSAPGPSAAGSSVGGSSTSSKQRPSSIRRSESLPVEPATLSAKWRGPGSQMSTRGSSELPRPETRAPAAVSVLPPEEPPPSPPPPLSGRRVSTPAARGRRYREEEDEEEEEHAPRLAALDSMQSVTGPESSSVAGTVTPDGRDDFLGLQGGVERDTQGLGKSNSYRGGGGGGGGGGMSKRGNNTFGTDDAELLRRKVQSLTRANRRLTKRVSRRDRTVSDMKKKVQHYRERLAVYEAPLPEDTLGDRRAKAREWERSAARSRSRANDSDFDASDSAVSRSPTPTGRRGGVGHSRFLRSETSSTLDSTPGSLQSQRSHPHTPASSFSASTNGSRNAGANVIGAGGAAGGAGATGSLVPPPLGRIRLASPSLSDTIAAAAPQGSSPATFPGPSTAAAAAALAAASAGAGSVGCVPVAVGITRMASRNRIPPVSVAPGLEPEEQAEREKEERAASAARAEAARSVWVFEADHLPPSLDLGGTEGSSISIFGTSRDSTASAPHSSLTPNLRAAYMLESGVSPLILEERPGQPAPNTPLSHTKREEGWDEVTQSTETAPSVPSVGRLSTNGDKAAPPPVSRDGQQRTSSPDAPIPAPNSNGLSVDHKKLFRPNLIIEFNEDSPAFRRKVEALDRNVEGLRGHLQQLVAVARKYCGSGFAFCENGRELAGILMNLRGESWFTRLGALAPALVSLGEVLGDIQSYEEETLLQSLENTFCNPMEDFVKWEVKTIRKMKQEMNRSCEDHEHAMARFLQLKRNSEESVTQVRAAEVALAKKRFEMARFDLVHHLNQLETKKKHQVVDRTCSALYAFLKLFHQCHVLVASTEPHMRELQHALKLSREDLEQEDQIWNEKRTQLEASLNEAIPPSVLNRAGFPPGPSPTLASTMPTASTTSTSASNFSSTWGGPSSATGGGGGASASSGGSQPQPPRYSPASQAKASAPPAGGGGGGPNSAHYTTQSPMPSTSGAGGGGAPSAASHSSSSSTPLRTAQKRAVSLASRLASGVSGGDRGGKGVTSFYGGVVDTAGVAGAGGGDTGSSLGGASSQTNTPPTSLTSSLPRSKASGSGSGWGGAKGGSGGVDAECGFCPSPVPSLATSTKAWRMGGVGWSSDEEDDEDDVEDGAGEAGASARRRKSEFGSGFTGGALWSPRQERCIKGGYLWKRSTNVMKDWKRRYFFIQNGKLFYQRQETYVSPPVRVCDIKLCHVKSCLKDSDLRYSFEIISPQQRTYVLQAEDEESHQSWVSVIKAEIEHLLSASQPAPEGWGTDMQASPLGSHSDGQPGGAIDFSLSKTQFNRLIQANPVCVDCGAKDPDWASISLAVMMCIECSGIHRSMGVHVSKVRSLTLDRWTGPLLDLLEKAGNARANKVWETRQNGGPVSKISPEADRPSREAYIRAKYEQRKFLDPPYDPSPEAVIIASQRLFAAAKGGDVLDVLWCLARGADVNWSNPAGEGCTAAHEASRGSHVALLELFANNGCSLDVFSKKQESPLTIATRANGGRGDAAAMSLLLSKLEGKQSQGGGGGSGASSKQRGGVGAGSTVGVGGPQRSAADAATAAAKVALALQQQQR